MRKLRCTVTSNDMAPVSLELRINTEQTILTQTIRKYGVIISMPRATNEEANLVGQDREGFKKTKQENFPQGSKS